MAASSRTTAGGSPDNACTQGVPARWAKQATDDMAGSERRALVREWLSGESCVPVAGARDGGQGLRGREAIVTSPSGGDNDEDNNADDDGDAGEV